MKTLLLTLFIPLVLAGGLRGAVPMGPVIVSLSPNGLLVCTNLSPGTVAAVASASSLNGPWLTNLKGLNAITVATNGSIQVNVPVSGSAMAYYRVLGVPAFNQYAGMALIPGGSFTMGDSSGDGIPDAMPINIYVSSFYMDSNLVTYSQWQTIYAYATNSGYTFDDPGSAKSNVTNQPVQTINWYDAVKWCNARSQNTGLTPVYYTDSALTQTYTNGDTDTVYPNWTANGYQLPTEAEWEKASRGGLSGNRFPWGMTISESQANYQGNTTNYSYDLGPNGYNTNFDTGVQPYTSPVGYFPANGYALNDMAGNLLEWCWDWYETPYGQPSTNNPTGPTFPSPFYPYRVARGGFWGFNAAIARCAARSPAAPATAASSTGFRCVKNP
ncbi:MAG TPA: SUMF1/EgtB/PvdO family nonheme iron enzyme [Candidatus Acidoferrales bacterium]|nr:SUMF1/EgtB/PvdO family nonheme iron enzyme [Candidatus Acidoferrales bacterium]